MSIGWAPLDGDWTRWRTACDRDWRHFGAPGDDLPDQGWKIHVSSRLADADTVRKRTAAACHSEGWSFKHLKDEHVLRRANDKDASRMSSGKFVTIYPAKLTEDLLNELAALLHDCTGPRVLGDLQWRGSVVHLRYGAFKPSHMWDGSAAVRRPDGKSEPDRRGVLFDPPAWVRLPDWMTTDRHGISDSPELSRVSIDGAYSFSNTGGVYRGTHDDHGRVVLKEGREFVGEHGGRDAAERVDEEHRMLRLLESSGVSPRTFGSFRSAGSAFVITEQVPGTPFNRAVMSKNPLTASHPDRDALHAHESYVRATIEAVQCEAARLHSIGAVHGDISPRNVLVAAPSTVRFVDFESCSLGEGAAATGPATPGFTAPSAVEGPDRDRFAIACLHLAALVPLTTLFPLDPGKIDEVLAAAEAWFPMAPTEAMRVVFGRCVALPRKESARADVPSANELAVALRSRVSSADPSAGGIEHGADGLLLALQRDAQNARGATTPSWPQAASGVGLFSGSASAALLGSTDPALVSRIRDCVRDLERVDLEDGLAGVGLALLCAPEPAIHRETVELIAGRLSAFGSEEDRPRQLPAGLRNGPSGLAMFLAIYGRLHEDTCAVEAAQRLLGMDLQRLEHRAGSGMQLVRDGRLVPFLASGSAGVGIALVQLFRATSDEALLPALQGIVEAAAPVFSAHAGLLDGRAGLIHFLVDAGELGHPSVDRAELTSRLVDHRRRLALHRLQTPGGVSYPDLQLRAVDDGWGHGAAGVLTALRAIEHFERGLVPSPDTPSFLRGARR